MRFATPEALVLLVLMPLVLWLVFARRRRGAGMISSVGLARGLPRSMRQRLTWTPGVLRAIAMVLLITAAARPQAGMGEVRTTAKGVAMMFVVDRSWSMTEMLDYDGLEMSRVEVVKRVFKEFVGGNDDDLAGRPEDMIGLVSFARYAETVCPLVRDHSTLVKLVDSIELAHPQGTEAGTAIGAGLALAASRLKKAEDDLARRNEGEIDPEFEIKSKVIVLLTDGEENILDPAASTAAQLCAEWGIRVYAIGIGGTRESAAQQRMRRRGFVMQGGGYGFDEAALKRIASTSDGIFRAVTDAKSLRDVYAEIDELEKTEVLSTEYTSYSEKFMVLGVVALVLLSLEFVLSQTLLRRTT